MNCPNCGTELIETALAHVNVHDCPSCKGLWFERNELERAKDSADPWVRWIDFDVFAAAKASGDHGRRNCPDCGADMSVLVYEHSDVKIDVCPDNHGVWLDTGEFTKIVTELDELTNTLSAKDYEHALGRELREIIAGGHESRFSEIRDFMATFRLLEMRLGAEHPEAAKMVNTMAERTPL
jgi:Zn-finger nucleic acid-binding protein